MPLFAAFFLAGSSGQPSRLPFLTSFQSRGVFNEIAAATCLVLAVSFAVLIYRCRRHLALGWVAIAFSVFLVAETINHALDSSELSVSNILSQFGTSHSWLIGILQVTGCGAAIFTLIGLPLALRRIYNTVSDAALARRTETRLIAASESSLAAIFMFEAIRDSDGIVADLRFLFVNRNAQQMIGASAEDIIGKPVFALFPALFTEQRMTIYRHVIETGESANLDFEHQAWKTSERSSILNIQVVKLDNGIVITATDITEREQTRKDLQSAVAHNKALILCSPFATVVTDNEGLITSVNPAAERMLRYAAAEMVGKNVTAIHDLTEVAQRAQELSEQTGTHIAPNHKVLFALPEKGATDEREWTYVRSDGSRLPVQLSVTALKDHLGSPTGFMGISYDLTERKRADQYIHHIAHHDPLTGLPTRTLLRDRLEVAIERAKRSCDQLAVVMIDLDDFKRVNDSLGHQAGDTLLCEITRRLRDCVRKSDTVARMGGDEFVVLLPDLHKVEDAHALAQKLLEEISRPIRIGRHDLTITGSFGISMFPECEDIDTLFKNADLAMYRIKNRGRNGVEVYTPGIGMESLKKLQMESALRVALQTNAFEIVYQPQISFIDNRLIGVEALLRWHTDEFGTVPPTTFIPIAEETGLIISIGEWVLRNACKQIALLQAEIGKELSVAVNISPRQFQQKNFPETVERALRISGLKPHQLELEITEQLLMIDSDESLEIMQLVRKIGVHFAIDDFGTGFSNMAYITRFAVDRIKIDRSFINKCDSDTNGRVVTSAIIALAHSLEIEVIAEGVETTSHVDTLVQMKCDSAQGYLYSRPLKLAALKEFASRLPTIPQHLEGKSSVRRAFTQIHESLVEQG